MALRPPPISPGARPNRTSALAEGPGYRGWPLSPAPAAVSIRIDPTDGPQVVFGGVVAEQDYAPAGINPQKPIGRRPVIGGNGGFNLGGAEPVDYTQAFTMAAWLRRTVSSGGDSNIGHAFNGSFGVVAGLVANNTSGLVGLNIGGASIQKTVTNGLPLNVWTLLVISKAAGTSTGRAHLHPEGGSWAHEDLAAAQAPASNGPAGGHFLAASIFGGVTGFDWALFGAWQAALSDLEAEALLTNRATRDWQNHAVTPKLVVPMMYPDTSLDLLDLMGSGAADTGTRDAGMTDFPLDWDMGQYPQGGIGAEQDAVQAGKVLQTYTAAPASEQDGAVAGKVAQRYTAPPAAENDAATAGKVAQIYTAPPAVEQDSVPAGKVLQRYTAPPASEQDSATTGKVLQRYTAAPAVEQDGAPAGKVAQIYLAGVASENDSAIAAKVAQIYTAAPGREDDAAIGGVPVISGGDPPPDTHPDLGGFFDEAATGGHVVELRRGGRVVARVRSGRYGMLGTGGNISEGTRSGNVEERVRSGSYDDGARSGEIL